jgi:hypothetical protein
LAAFEAIEKERLARAWQRLAPDDDEVRYAVTRIAVRLRPPARSFGRGRSSAAVFGGVVFVAALAYAAQAGVPWAGRSRPSSEVVGAEGHPSFVQPPEARPSARGAGGVQSAAGAASRATTALAVQSARSASAALGDAPDSVSNGVEPPTGQETSPVRNAEVAPTGAAQEPAADVPPASARGPRRAPVSGARTADTSAQDAASWRLVDEALSEQDDARAEALLGNLARSTEDDRTRAAALLGLAQLHAGRGECTEARRIALSVASQTRVPMTIARRAQRVLGACFAR